MSSAPENVCALCLEAIPNAVDAKVCEKCCRKHKFNSRDRFDPNNLPSNGRSYSENRCNLCKMILPHVQKLQEHLVEHTFAGCEDRGFICYICSAVFTAPNGLLGHMTEHGLNAKPYDCNLCIQKFYFRAELDHHLVDHEIRERTHREIKNAVEAKLEDAAQMPKSEIKKEVIDERRNEDNVDDDDEYIEVEKVPEIQTNTDSSQKTNKADE